MLSPIGSATSGMVSATRRFESSARRVAALSAADPNMTVEPVEQVSAATQFKASAKTAKTADEMLGALLDILV